MPTVSCPSPQNLRWEDHKLPMRGTVSESLSSSPLLSQAPSMAIRILTIPQLDASLAEVRKQFDLNVFAPILVIQSFFPLLRNSPAPAKLIVNNTSCEPA